MISQDIALRYIIVDTIDDLLQLGTGKLAEGARCIVREASSNLLPGNREYIYTKKDPKGTISFTNGRALHDNVVEAMGTGLWVAQRQVGSVTLNGTTPVVVEDVFVLEEGEIATFETITFRRRVLGAGPGFVAVTTDANGALVFESSSGTDDGGLTWALFSNF